MSELKDIQKKTKKIAWKRTSVFFIYYLIKLNCLSSISICVITTTDALNKQQPIYRNTMAFNTYGKMKLLVQSTELLAKESENAFIPDNDEWHRQHQGHALGDPFMNSHTTTWWNLDNDRRDIMKLLNLSKKATDMRNIANKTAIELVAYESSSKFKILENNVNLINNQLQNMNKHISNLEERLALSEEKLALSEERLALSDERLALSDEKLALSEERKKNLDTNYSSLKNWMFVLAFTILTIGYEAVRGR